MQAPALEQHRTPFVVEFGPRTYDLSSRALIMGIVNRTPDSFYDRGATFELERAIAHACQLIDDGADIIDIGGVKAGIGPEVAILEEIERVVPVVEALAARFDTPISIDTWRSEVADEAFKAGAICGNDISGFSDPDYLHVAATHGASVVATHIRLQPRTLDPDPIYPNDDVVTACENYLHERIDRALKVGLKPAQIIVDAGLDLGKSTLQSLQLLRASDRLLELGHPLFLAASQKDFLGELLALDITQRGDATLGAVAFGIAKGCRIVRVHDVKRVARIVNSLDAILSA